MKKALIITYYWPPSGGGGVQRWLKFVKYLRGFGWEPIIFTPENPEMPAVDESLLDEIPEGITLLQNKIWEPYAYYKKFTGRKSEDKIQTAFLNEKKQKSSLVENLSVWIRGNLFIPDARKFWVKPSVKFISAYLKENPVDVVVTTGPPHSAHLIGLALQKKHNIRWLADFRDPWTNIDYYKDLKLGKRADAKHHKFEEKVLQSADAITVISPGMERDFQSLHPRKYFVIPNGFDAADMTGLIEIEPEKEKFVIAHIGSLTKTRNPVHLWEALQQLILEDGDFAGLLEIRNVGKMDVSITEALHKAGLGKYLKNTDYLPHNEVLLEQRKASVLLLLINNTPNAKLILTGKLFEYLAAQRPIICIGPEDGDAAEVIRETGAGNVFGFSDVEGVKEMLRKSFLKFKTQSLVVKSASINKYERKNLTKRMAQAMNSCTVSPQESGSQNS